jgi:hypothetical protein
MPIFNNILRTESRSINPTILMNRNLLIPQLLFDVLTSGYLDDAGSSKSRPMWNGLCPS